MFTNLPCRRLGNFSSSTRNETLSLFLSTVLSDRAAVLHGLWRSNRRPISAGSWWLHMARILPQMLRLPLATRPTTIVLSEGATSLLQGRLCKVSKAKTSKHTGCYLICVTAAAEAAKKKSRKNFIKI
jgi:hypothetical protein